MIDRPETIELLIRGANAGGALLLSGAMLSLKPFNWRAGLGALFVVSAACYVLASSPKIIAAFGVLFTPLHVLSICAAVFFWWFSLALFDDGFRWRWPLMIPLAMTAPLVVANFVLQREPSPLWVGSLWLSRAAFVFGYAHAIYIAIRFANDDLMEGRRRFRFVFAIAVAIMGLIVIYAESTGLDEGNPRGLMLLQASAIAALTFGLGLWLINGGFDVLRAPSLALQSAPEETAPSLAPADRASYATLMRLMGEGVYREEALSVAGLAAKVGVAEHQLRRLINGELGFRNFSAFLNSYRIEDAKKALADPAQARRQVLQIALDVGFGSIAPFNRAFKEATGVTPTEYRRSAGVDG